MKNIKSKLVVSLIAFLYSCLTLQSVVADDTEVFFGGGSASSKSNPNILFVFDTSGSMNSNQSFTDPNGNKVTQSRIGILQDVMGEIVSGQQGVNMGLARFSVPGGPILYPVVDPDEPAEPIVLRGIESENDDAMQSGATVDLNGDYLNSSVVGDVVAFRFRNVSVPQGAKITNANLIFATDIDSSDLASYKIYAEVDAQPEEFKTVGNDLSKRIDRTSVAVDWTPEAWDAEPIASTDDPLTTFNSPNISSVLQQVVDLKGATMTDAAGWCGGKDLVILMEKTSIEGRPIVAYDKNKDFAPKIRIDFDKNIPASEFGCYENTVVSVVNRYDNDSEKDSNGNIYENYWNLIFSRSGNYKTQSVAFSFEDVKVPKDAQITDARIKLVASRSNSGNAESTIKAVKSANPTVGTGVHNLSSGFTSGITWSIDTWDYGVQYQTADLSSIVNEIVTLGSWKSGNKMSFLFTVNSGYREAYSLNGSGSRAAALEVKYIGRFTSDAATKRQELIATIEDFKATGNTPISDSIAEAGLYFKGEPVAYGLKRGSPTKRDNRVSHVDALSSGSLIRPSGCTESNLSATGCKGEKLTDGSVYKTPIKNACQANHIVLLTDGAPTSHDSITNTLYSKWSKEITGTAGTCNTNDNGKDCTIKMAGLFNKNDMIPSTPGAEKVTTHTIGFYSDQEFLQSVADAGGGKYVTAFSKQELIDAVTDIVDSILDVNTTFVSAGVTVNQYNRLTHNDELYFSLFAPSSETVWPGNLKRYRLLDGELVDVDTKPAVNIGGEFDETSKSWWSSSVDGNEVEEGGAAEFLSASRKVYSNLQGDSDVTLTASDNRVHKDNSNINNAMVGATDASDREKILNWANGQDVNNKDNPTGPRKQMGDPLHSQPTVLIYKTGANSFRSSVYVGTNEGFVHSFNTSNGNENWAFIPKELLPRLSSIQKDAEGQHTYGMDGSVTLHIDEKPGVGMPGVVDAGEKAYLYIGMRRGGSTYYALDISDPDAPKMMFKIDATTLGTSGGRALGQTWSQPVIKKTKFEGHETVLLFGGGYSVLQDVADTISVVDGVGRNVFMVNAKTGELVWDVSQAIDASTIPGSKAGSLSSMNAIPDQITAFDLTGDDYIDHFYAADTKAQVFRFDINYTTGKITGGRIARLNQGGLTAANNRRFYNTPDVSLVRLTSGSFVSVSIGSGYRAHPLNETVVDHFYMVKDKGILNGNFDMDVELGDLADVTDVIGDADADGISDAVELIEDESSPKKGWYITFPRSGEKVITSSITFNNSVIFTTYTPPNASGSLCDAVAGTSRLYLMRVTDGNPFLDNNSDAVLTKEDRSVELKIPGIAPPPQVLLEKTDSGVVPRLCVGNRCDYDLPPPPEGIMGIRWRKN
ncbi:pilus assembly protein [Aliikangiella sp. IMCC44653]